MPHGTPHHIALHRLMFRIGRGFHKVFGNEDLLKTGSLPGTSTC